MLREAIMKFSVQDIKDAVAQTESARADYVNAANIWREMWKLCFWTNKDREQAKKEGRELHTLMWPRNTVNLANRLIGVDPKISCPSYDEGDMDNSKARGEWLKTLWQVQAYGQKMHPLHALRWHMNVSARCVVRLLWTGNLVDEMSKGSVPPLLIQPLDPMNVGWKDGLYYPQWVYHRYAEDIGSVVNRYPQAKASLIERYGDWAKTPGKTRRTVMVTDFWYCDDSGKKKHRINNAIMVDDTIVKEFNDLPYPRIPIFYKLNDPAPINDALWEGGSILSGQYESWKVSNQLASMHLTAVQDHFWPELNLVNENGEQIPDLERGRGAQNTLPPGTKILPSLTNNPQVQLSSSLMDVILSQQQQATFPAALYGDPGAMRSAYGFSMMSNAGLGRISDTIFQLQQLCQEVNSMALCMIKKFGGEPITLFGYDKSQKGMYSSTLSPDQVGDRYDNTVLLTDNMPTDGIQGLIAALQMYDRKIISGETVREDYSAKPARKDEVFRVLEEQVWQDPDLLRERMRHVFQARYGVELPPGEPDGQMTQKPPGMQMPQTIPGAGIPNEMQGQLSPEGAMGNAGADPAAFQTMGAGNIPSPDMLQQIIQQRGMG